MKLLIASDIHGSAFYLRRLMEVYHRERAEKLLLLGDLLYHGPRNDLPEGYDPKEVIAMLNNIKNELLCVRGNCDTEVDQMVLDFPILADYALIVADGQTIFATHGHKYNTSNPPPMSEGTVLLHGHTHVPVWEDHGTYLYCNPGSVSIPKQNSPHSCLLLEDTVFHWKTLEGNEFMTLPLHA